MAASAGRLAYQRSIQPGGRQLVQPVLGFQCSAPVVAVTFSTTSDMVEKQLVTSALPMPHMHIQNFYYFIV
jgi:hypothetical protein